MRRKKIIITGATRGIGREIALLFARNNWDIAYCSRSAEHVERLLSELDDNGEAQHIGETCDVSQKPEVERFASSILARWDYPNVLVNNAGTFIPGQIHSEPDSVLPTLWGVNVLSTYYMSRSIIPAMLQRADGHIINICSIAGTQAYANGGSYGITKFAQYGLTKNLREELKPHGIGVTAILPGATRTESWDGTDLPDSRFIDPAHIAEVVWQCVTIRPRSVVEEIVIRPQEGDI
ncbi:MAG: SDR family oxidoreductase [Flavobacteriales bacterium]|nr:SDR family oxidoreductase [Flavobacteriales bacterium]